MEPHLLGGGPFTVAEGVRARLPRAVIDSAHLARPFHGLRVPRETEADPEGHPIAQVHAEILRSARLFSAHMHEQEFFSHSTAALMWGIPLPAFPSTDIHVSVLAPHRAPRGRGVRGHQLGERAVSRSRHEALAVTDAATSWSLLAAELRHPYDLVAAADAVIRDERMPGPRSRILRPRLAGRAELAAAIAPGRRGAVALRQALDRARPGAASRMETWMRLTVVDAGLPEPVLDHDVYDASGEFLGCLDGAYPELRVGLEYEGDHHRTDERQWQRDILKHDSMARVGWRIIRVTKDQLLRDPGAFTARVRGALRAAS